MPSEYAIRAVEVKRGDLKFIGTNQPFHYADDVIIFGGSEHSIKKNTESVEAASKEIEIQVNCIKTKYMVMF